MCRRISASTRWVLVLVEAVELHLVIGGARAVALTEMTLSVAKVPHQCTSKASANKEEDQLVLKITLPLQKLFAKA